MSAESDSPNTTVTFWAMKYHYVPTTWEIAVATSVIGGILGIFGAVTNAFVMFLITRLKKNQEIWNMDILVLNLCFSDFLFSAVTQPQLIIGLLSRTRPPVAQGFWRHVSIHVTLTSGFLSLLVITFDRYISIKFPYRYPTYATRSTLYIFLAFIWGITIGTVAFIFVDPQTETQVHPILITLAFSLTLVLQAKIFMIVKAQNRNAQRQIEAVQHNDTSNSGSPAVRGATTIRSLKTNTTIRLMSFVYIGTWLPSVIFRLYYTVNGDFTLFLKWVHIFSVILQFHSCINPYVYALRTSRIRRVLIRYLATTLQSS